MLEDVEVEATIDPLPHSRLTPRPLSVDADFWAALGEVGA
jgi:hypothetical protein